MVLPKEKEEEINSPQRRGIGEEIARKGLLGTSSALAGFFGVPGDVESLVRGGVGLLGGDEGDQILPTSQDLLERGRERGSIPTPETTVEDLLSFGGNLFGGALFGSVASRGVRGAIGASKAKQIPKAATIVSNLPQDVKGALSFATGGTAIEAGGRKLDLSPQARAAAQLVLPVIFKRGLARAGIKSTKGVSDIQADLKKVSNDLFTKSRKFTAPLKERGLNNFKNNFVRISDQAVRVRKLKKANEPVQRLIDGMIDSTADVAFGKKTRGARSVSNFSPAAMFTNFKDINEEITRVTGGKDTAVNELFTKLKNIATESIRIGGASDALKVFEDANQSNAMLKQVQAGVSNLRSLKPGDFSGGGVTGAALGLLTLFYKGAGSTILKAGKIAGLASKAQGAGYNPKRLRDIGEFYKTFSTNPELQKAAIDLIEATNATDFKKSAFLAAARSFNDEYSNAIQSDAPVKIYPPKKKKKK